MLSDGARGCPTGGGSRSSGAAVDCGGHDEDTVWAGGGSVKQNTARGWRRGYNPAMAGPTVDIHPVTPDRWGDLERLFGPSGGYGGCWCVFFRMRAKDFATAKARENKACMRALVESGDEPGLIAYVDGEPAGWVSLDRRERFLKLEYSRLYKRIDDQPVWSVVCFVVGRRFRRQRLSERLLAAAVDHARRKGARILEAYPVEVTGKLTGYSGYTGIRSVFDRAGFKEAGRVGESRPIMRLTL